MVVLAAQLAPPPAEPPIRLNASELRRLRRISRDPKSSPSRILAAKVVLHAARPGRARRVEWEYRRHGIVHLLASFDVCTGRVVGEFADPNNSAAFINFLTKLSKLYPKGKIYLILDNGTTHCSLETKRFFSKHKRFVPVFTPTHASWLNQIEIWFSALSRHALRYRSFESQDDLRKQIEAYIAHHNRELAMPFEWTTKGKPLTGATAKARRRSRSIPRDFRMAARC